MFDQVAYNRSYYARNRERLKARARERRLASPEQKKAQDAAYYRLNRDRILARSKQWCTDNPRRARELAVSRQHTLRARRAGTFLEVVDPALVYERDEGVCGICGKPVDRDEYELDHIVPTSRGGPHCYANVQLSHPPCNRSKGTD